MGKTSQSTQQVTIPPEVMARYNAVNARAESVANKPFQQYGTRAEDFVAPLTQSQQQGIAQTQQYAQAAQPYFQYATNQLQQAQQQGQAGLNAAYPMMQYGMQQGQQLGQEAYGGYQNMLSSFMPSYQQAQQGIQQGLGAGQNYLGQATNFAMAGSQAVNPQQFSQQAVGQYMSPYVSNVVEQTMKAQAQQNAQQRQALSGDAIKAGAFGGDRAGIAQANLAYQQNQANQQTIANLYNQGYGQALGAFQQQQGVNLAAEQANRQAMQQTGQALAGFGQQAYGMGTGAAQQQAALGQALAGLYGQQAQGMAGLSQQQFGQGMTAAQQQAQLAQMGYGMGAGTAQQMAQFGQGAQQAGISGAQAMMGAGQMQQQTEQAGLQALYNQFMQQQGYDFQVAQFLANIAMGTGALSGSTTTTTQPSSFFSDRRLKENIRKIGETEDGLPIHKFNYKGENKDQTHIGYMADEVEKKHPDAVGKKDGYKYVDYAKVNARESMGGAVHDGGLGRAKYADGGSLDALIEQRNKMYGTGATKGGPTFVNTGEGTPGASMYVPAAKLPVGQLMQPSKAPPPPQSAAGQGMDAIKTIKGLTSDLGQMKEGASSAVDWLKKLSDSGDVAKASGGVVPRQHFAFGGEDMYKTDQSYVPKEVLETDKKIEPLKPASGGGGGGGGGGGALGTIASIAGTAAKVLPFFLASGGVVPRQHFDDGGAANPEHPVYDLLRKREGFLDTPKWDVNALRGGYGTDTFTTPEGKVMPVTADTRFTKEDADRDLRRRVGEFQQGIQGKIGGDTWGSMNPNTQAALTSVAYNYGSLPDSVAKAVQTGDNAQIAQAVNALGVHNKGVNAQRRAYEASLIDPEGKYAPAAGGGGGGLGRGAQVAAAQTQQTPSMLDTATDKAKGLGDYLTSSKFLVPLGTGLLTMASSPSRYLGAAALQGLGAGLAAMNVPEKQEAEIAQTKMQTAGQGVSNLRGTIIDMGNGVTGVLNAAGKPIPIYEWIKTREPLLGGPQAVAAAEAAYQEYAKKMGLPAGSSGAAAGQAGQGPQGGPDLGAQKPEQAAQEVLPGIQYGQTSSQFAKREPELSMGFNSEANKKISQNYALNTAASAEKARDSAPQLGEMLVNTANGISQKGLGAAGAGFYDRANLINIGNTVGRVFEPLLGTKIDLGNADTIADLNKKLATLQGSDIARIGGQESFAALQQILQAIPNNNMTPDAQAQLGAQLMVLSQKAKDREAHMQRYGQDSNNSYVLAGRSFDQENSATKYQQQIGLMKQALLTHAPAVKMMTSGQADPQVIEDFFKKLAKERNIPYTPGMSRMFMGQ